jgi:hypothetical protein
MKHAAVLLLLAIASTSLSAGPITILSVTGGTPGIAPGIFPIQTLGISFTVGQPYSAVSITPDLLGSFSGTAYLTTQIGPGTTVADQIASHAFTSTGGFQTVLQNVSIGPGTYFLVLSTAQNTPPQGWATSTSPVTIAATGASTPFGTYVSFDENAYAPSDSFGFFPSINGSITTPEFIIAGTLQTQQTALQPGAIGPADQFIFNNVGSGLWFDPATASSFEYMMTSGSLFTSILNFPTGFTNPFTVSAGGVVLGTFSPGQSLVFPNGGVSDFTVSGINPLVDPSNTSSFPLELAFNTATASFTQQAVPEPSALSLAGIGLALLAFVSLWRHSGATPPENCTK